MSPSTYTTLKNIRDRQTYDAFIEAHSFEIERCSHLKSYLDSIDESLKAA